MSLSVIHRNEISLTGRLVAAATERVLPAGDVLVLWRIAVHRPGEPGRVRLVADTIDCVARRPAIGRRAQAWAIGDIVALDGALRRRFWRAPEGIRSRYEVEVTAGKRVAKAGTLGEPGTLGKPSTLGKPGRLAQPHSSSA